MIKCAMPSPREKLEKHIKDYYYACLQGDYKCYPECPMLEKCWKEDIERLNIGQS